MANIRKTIHTDTLDTNCRSHRTMGVIKPYQIETCAGLPVEANLIDSLNIFRTPEKRQEILQAEYNKITDPNGKQVTVEKPFLYTDFDRNEVILVKPPNERYFWREASRELLQIVAQLSETVSPTANRFVRVVFGLGELREKLLARDAGIDDRILELFKVLLAYEHPIILQQPRLNVNLHAIDDRWLTFIAAYEHDKTTYQLQMPRSLADDLLAQPNELKQWVADSHQEDLFELDKSHDYWINFRRWSPTETALSRLAYYADQARRNQAIDTRSSDFQVMLQGLPSGNHMPRWGKQALRDLFNWAKARKDNPLQDRLFELRFDKRLDDDWYLNNDPNDIDTLWKLLQNLPDTNVEGNTRLDVIDLDAGVGNGAYYDPGADKIVMGTGTLANQEGFEDVMRHEVGHAVHAQLDGTGNKRITNWLQQQFGWQFFRMNDGDIDSWVNLMGGYGNLTPQQKQEVRGYLKAALGPGGQWGPPQLPNIPAGHPWNTRNFGPRLAFERTDANWYRNHSQWYRVNGRAFFLNFYYRTFMVVNESTLAFVDRMPSSYAAMSPDEFFAELYALFYDLDDPKWGVIPSDIRDWLWNNVGSPVPISGKLYVLRNKKSGQVLDVAEVSKEDGANVIQWTPNNGENQQWLLRDTGDGYSSLIVKHSGKALDVPGASQEEGAKIQQFQPNGTDAQKWKLEEVEAGYCILISKGSGKVLTVSEDSSQSGALMQQQTYQERDTQKWRFEAR